MESFILVKPDYVPHSDYLVKTLERLISLQGLSQVLEITGREAIEKMGRDFMARFYEPNKDAPHFPTVLDHWTGKPSEVIWLEGGFAFKDTFKIAGIKTDPYDCSSYELRGAAKHLIPAAYQGDANQRKLRNIVHRSDPQQNLERELALLHELLD